MFVAHGEDLIAGEEGAPVEVRGEDGPCEDDLVEADVVELEHGHADDPGAEAVGDDGGALVVLLEVDAGTAFDGLGVPLIEGVGHLSALCRSEELEEAIDAVVEGLDLGGGAGDGGGEGFLPGAGGADAVDGDDERASRARASFALPRWGTAAGMGARNYRVGGWLGGRNLIEAGGLCGEGECGGGA